MLEDVTWGDTEEEFEEAVKPKTQVKIEEPVIEEKSISNFKS